tara:strand:- start:2267 stop:4306 length:2040 start_codon:yes stop_codon:yes gene_type:complete
MIKKTTIILISFFLIFSCKHEIENARWDVDLILPIMYSNMDINMMLTDSNIIISENDEGYVSLIFNQNFIDLNLDTLINIDTTADEQTHKLDSVTFEDIIIPDTSTIGELINSLPGGSLIFPNGTTMVINNLPNIITEDTINIDASEYFQTMNLYKGNLIIEIKNGFPTDVSDVEMTIINPSNQNIIASFFFPIILSGETKIDSADIGGKILDENIIAIVNNLSINESNGPVTINYGDAIITTIKMTDIGITEATAIFPEQQLTEKLKEHNFSFGTAQIKEIGIKEGTVSVNVSSTLPNGKMIYNIPSLKKNGIPFSSGEMIVPKSTSNNLTTFTFDFEGYILDLTGEDGRLGGDTVNTIYTESYTFIDSTGILETINSTDSFYSYIDFDLSPEYALGFLGQDTIEYGPEEIDISLFKNMSATLLNLEETELSIKINNYIGADIGVKINTLTGINNNTGETASIGTDQNGNNVIGHNYKINRATINNVSISPSEKNIIMNSDQIIEILPNNIQSSANFYLNPDGQQNTDDFLYPEFPIEAELNMEIPLSLIAEELILIDTNEININDDEDIDLEKIYITIENEFPLSGEINLLLMDEAEIIIDTLLGSTKFLAGIQQDDGSVIPTKSTIELENIDLSNVSSIISISKFSTEPLNEFVKIYSDYNMDITISVKVKQKIGE